MRRIKRATVFLAALLLLALPVRAAEQPGSITVSMACGGEAVPGGSITLYRVAGLGDGVYVPEPEFRDCGVDWNGPLTAADAGAAAEYARSHCIEGETAALDADGWAEFAPLEPGLYLLDQQEAGEGFLPANPFFAAIPQQTGGAAAYDVTAHPKCAPEPTEPEPPNIPQTGQRKWPVPVLVAVGMGFFGAGWLLWRRGERREA